MDDGLQTTLDLLAETENEAAIRVLIPRWTVVSGRSATGRSRRSLRRSPAGHREVVARLHTIDPQERYFLEENHRRMTPALREAILDSDRQTHVNGCQAAVSFRQYDLIPTLLNALEDTSQPQAAILGQTLMDLADQLCRDLAASRQSGKHRELQMAREQAVASLELSIHRYGKHRRREVVEALALLAHRDNATLKQILRDPYHPTFLVLVEVLSRSTRGPILRLVLSYLEDPKAPSAALSVMAKRRDLDFVKHLLRKIGRDPSPDVAQNLKRIESVVWAQGGGELLDHLDDLAQEAAVRLVMLSGIPRASTFTVIEHLLLRGGPGGRRAAAEALEQFHGTEANALAIEALDDDDPEVQAIVVGRLRGRGIAGALGRLVGMLDSPQTIVRRAARRSLAEFTFPRFLATYDLLDDESRRSTGNLVKRVDPQTVPLLRAEMTSRMRTRRLRAGDRPDAPPRRVGGRIDRAVAGGRGSRGPRRGRRRLGERSVLGQLRRPGGRHLRPQPRGPRTARRALPNGRGPGLRRPRPVLPGTWKGFPPEREGSPLPLAPRSRGHDSASPPRTLDRPSQPRR